MHNQRFTRDKFYSSFITIKYSIDVFLLTIYDHSKYMEKEQDGLLNFFLGSGPRGPWKWVVEQEIVENGWSFGGLQVGKGLVPVLLSVLWGLISWYAQHGLTEYYFQSVLDSLLVTHDFMTTLLCVNTNQAMLLAEVMLLFVSVDLP